MSGILTIYLITVIVLFCFGRISSLNPGILNKTKADKPWQLDAKKAKTVARVASNGEVLLSRKKRGWWWGESREEKEEDREGIAACQRRCWGSWGAASQCSVRCGNGGQRTRRRQRVRHDCSCPGVDWKSETCGNSCQNGGTPRLRDCSCPVGFTNDCCETRVRCGNPGSPPHGSVSPAGNTHYYNTQAHYSCDPGWEIIGGSNPRTCRNDGLWSGSIPRCRRVRCPHPGTPQDGRVAPPTGFVYETLVQFSCNPGFSLEGSETSECERNRQWSHTPPTCNRISCGDPGNIPDGTVSGTRYLFEDIITYSCNPGFTLIGSSERECQADGTWSCNQPRCVSSISLIPKCPTINQIDYGSLTLTDDNNYQSIAEYACDEGYHLNGNSHRACLADQQWSGTEPSCVRITCPRLTNPINGQVDQPAGSPEYGSQATFTCNSGHRLDGDETVTCGGIEAMGVWSATSPLCHAVDCGTPARPDNGRIVGTEFTFQRTVQVQCGPGFYLDGPAQLTCNENAAWVGGESSPMCIECPLDYYKAADSSATSCTSCPDHSHTTSKTSNNILQCLCDTGYEGPDGGPCTIITCLVLMAPANGVVEPCSNEYRSVCTLSCEPGHIVSAGHLTRECLYTRFWSGETLKCSACPKDTYQNETYKCERCPDNSVTSGAASVFADCTCASGFVRSSGGQACLDIDECSGDDPCQQECINSQGSYRCDCMSGWILDGLPEDNPTDCVKAMGTCPADQLIPPPNGGFVCGVVNVYEEYCSAFCNPGFEILGLSDEYITCNIATGWQWSHVLNGNDLPICTLIIFQDPVYSGSVNYFEAECAGLTEQQKDSAVTLFIEKLELYGICSQQLGGACQVESADITCGESFTWDFRRKKRQAETDTMTIRFNFTIGVGSECTEVNCQEKYDRLVQAEVQRIHDELHAASQPNDDGSGCPLCIKDPNTGNPLQMNLTGEVQVPCPDGYQRKGYSCRQCAAGMYHDKETGECTLCPAGEYQPDVGQTSCLSCPYLTALNKLGAKKCPVPPEETYDCQSNNPCLKADDPEFRMFYSHTNANKFIQCTGHEGGCYEMPCPATLVWNPNSNICAPLSLIPLNSIY